MPNRIKVMFVCTGNSARSQMAEGFARHYGAGRVEAHSAGMEPSRLNPNAVAVMRERGIDITPQQSRAFDEALARRMDYVITVCGSADERCPVLPPGVRRLHWPLDDPARAQGTAGEILQVFRRSRDEIERLGRNLILSPHRLLTLHPPVNGWTCDRSWRPRQAGRRSRPPAFPPAPLARPGPGGGR